MTSTNSNTPSPLERTAAQVIARWIQGEKPDAEAAMLAHPEFAEDKSVILDLAFAEFVLREERGEKLDLEAFCSRFPNHHASLGRLLAQQSVRDIDNIRNTVDFPIVPVHLQDPKIVESAVTRPAQPAAPGAPDTHPAVQPDVAGANTSAANPRSVWPEPGSRVGDYNLVRAMGKGAFGRVFLAFEETTNRHVVVKLSKQKCDEAKVLGKLLHKNVVSVLSAPRDVATGLYIVVMPYLGSATLEDLIELAFPAHAIRTRLPKKAAVILQAAQRNLQKNDPRSELSPDSFLNRVAYLDGVVWLGIRIADALAAVHRCGYLHHDLKPSNVLLGLDGQPRLLDFNLASDVRESKSRLGGTLPYMAPEHLQQCQQPDAKLPPMDLRGDLFSFGVIMYELLCGTHPFGRYPKSRSIKSLASDILSKQKIGARPLRSINPEVSIRLSRVIERCLSFDPNLRPANAEELALELRKCYSTGKKVSEFAGSSSGRTVITASLIGLISGVTWMVKAEGATVVHVPDQTDHRSLGLTAMETGRYQEAVAHLGISLQGNQRDADAWLASGRSRIALNEFRSARHDVQMAVQLQPGKATAWATLAWLQAKEANHEEAVKSINKAIDLGYDNSSLRGLLAYCHAQRQLNLFAFQEIDRILMQQPDCRIARANKVFVHFTQAMSKNESLKKSHFEELDQLLKLSGPVDYNLEYWAACNYLQAAQQKNVAPGSIDPLQAKQLAYEYYRKAVEHGYPGEWLKTDSNIRMVFGDISAEIDTWKRPESKVKSINCRMGDALTDFAG